MNGAQGDGGIARGAALGELLADLTWSSQRDTWRGITDHCARGCTVSP